MLPRLFVWVRPHKRNLTDFFPIIFSLFSFSQTSVGTICIEQHQQQQRQQQQQQQK
jgi:hypothetical protein